MANCYISCFDVVQRATTGLETASLIGNISRLSGLHAMGATTLTPTSSLTVAFNPYDRITLFDGSSSEQVIVSSSTGTSITIQAPGLLYPHNDGTPWCSDGTLGSLGDEIINASDWLENICQQTLFFSSITETWRMPSMRATIDNQSQLMIRPSNFPITALTSLNIKSNNSVATSYDATQAIIEGNGQVISLPWLIAGGGSGGSTYSIIPTVSRATNLWITLTYTHGFTLTAMPGSIKDAAVLLTSDILARRFNPSGADSFTLGKRSQQVSTRGDTSAMSGLQKQAMRQLQSYVAEAF